MKCKFVIQLTAFLVVVIIYWKWNKNLKKKKEKKEIFAIICPWKKNDAIPGRIRYTTGSKIGVTYFDSHNYGKRKKKMFQLAICL